MIKELIRRTSRENLWKLTLVEAPEPSLVSASIRLDSWTLEFRCHPEAEKQLQALGIGPEDQERMIRALVHHEMGHWEICPFDKEGQYLLVEAVSRAASCFRGWFSQEGMAWRVSVMTNFVADLFVNTVSALEDPSWAYGDGIALAMIKEFKRTPARDPIFEAHVGLNLLLWSDHTHYARRLCRLNRMNEIVEAAVEKAARLFDFAETPQALRSALRLKGSWPGLAMKLSEIFLPLFPEEKLSWWLPSVTESQSVSDRREFPITEAILERSSGAEFPSVLGILYEGRAGLVRVIAPEAPQAGERQPLSPLVTTPVDPLAPPPAEAIVWGETQCRPVARGRRPRLMLHETRHSVENLSAGSLKGGVVPDLAFVLDSSGSMDFNPYGGAGEYDLVLRAVFGVFQWLKTKGLLLMLRYAVINFSFETLYSGWLFWHEKNELYRFLFTYQGGETRLDLKTLSRLAAESRGPFTAIMITDGEIENGLEAARFVRSRFLHPQSFVLLQVGGTSEFSRRLARDGYPVTTVKDPKQLGDLTLTVVRTRCAL